MYEGKNDFPISIMEEQFYLFCSGESLRTDFTYGNKRTFKKDSIGWHDILLDIPLKGTKIQKIKCPHCQSEVTFKLRDKKSAHRNYLINRTFVRFGQIHLLTVILFLVIAAIFNLHEKMHWDLPLFTKIFFVTGWIIFFIVSSFWKRSMNVFFITKQEENKDIKGTYEHTCANKKQWEKFMKETEEERELLKEL